MPETAARLKILTPMHIGTGIKYGGLEYLLEKKAGQTILHRFSPEILFAALGDRQDKFPGWLDKCLEQNKQLTLQNFCQEEKIAPATLFPHSSYSLPLPANFASTQEISDFTKQGVFPFIPGSEVKGAIRTAVLYELLKKDEETISWLVTEIDEAINKKKHLKKILEEQANNPHPNRKDKGKLTKAMGQVEDKLQKRLLRTGPGGGSADAQYDLLKFLQVGDSLPLSSERQHLQVCLVVAKNTNRNVRLWQEILVPDTEVDLSDFQVVVRQSYYLDQQCFSDNQQAYLRDARGAAILAACHQFAADLLEEEKEYFQKHQPDIVPIIDELSEMNSPEAPLLRLGMGQGYLSVTVNLLLKRQEPDIYNRVLIHTTRNVSYSGTFPKTRRLVHFNGQDWPLGWVQLQVIAKSSLNRISTPWQSQTPAAPGPEIHPPAEPAPPTAAPAERPEFLALMQQAERVRLVPQEFGTIMQKWEALANPEEKVELAHRLIAKLRGLPLKKKDKLYQYLTRLEEYLRQEKVV